VANNIEHPNSNGQTATFFLLQNAIVLVFFFVFLLGHDININHQEQQWTKYFDATVTIIKKRFPLRWFSTS
jgi:hypothetical protein